MRKLYNTFTDLARNFRNFFNNICTLSKPQNKFISDCIVGMIKAESVVTTDIIKKLPRDYFDETLFSSKEKKFYRFFNNTRYKSNGFYLESTQTRNIQAFTSLFTLMNVALLWLTIIGADYSKSKGKISKYFKIRYSKRVSTNSESKKTSNYRRFLSIFNIGLILFNLAYESPHYYNLKINFQLYDI